MIHGVAAGTTPHYAQSVSMYWGLKEYYPSCPVSQQEPSAATNVGLPTGEITEFDTYQISAGQFLMTLEPSASSYDGNSVTESSPVIGTNACWWNGSNMEQYPTVAGSTWVVDQATLGTTNTA